MPAASPPSRKPVAAPSRTKSAKALESLRAMQRIAAATGADKITEEEIRREIAAARRVRKQSRS